MTKIIRANQIKFNYENLKKQWKELLSKYYLPSGELDSSYTKVISCPHCNGNNFSNEFCLNGFWHKTCGNCNVVYVSPRLSDECIEELYSSSYYNEVYATSMLPAFEVRKNTIGIGKYNQVIKLVDASLIGKRVLDIGAGIGEVSDVFQDKGWEVHSTEMNELAIKWLNTRGFSEVFHGDFYSYTSAYKYDVIMAWGVIEHVLDPRKFLQKVFHYLAPGGVFVSEVPNGDSVLVDVSRDMGLDPERILMGEQHIVLYSLDSYIELHENAGLKKLHIQTNGLDIDTLFKVNKMSASDEFISALQSAVDKRFGGDLLRGFWKKI